MKIAVIFGGAGFIGLHFTQFLLRSSAFDRVILADVKPPQVHAAFQFIASEFEAGVVVYEKCDVRQPIDLKNLTGNVAFIANFAAVHREPGHEGWEYFETNIKGAKNVSQFAESVGCNDILFTSSISPYGPTEEPKDETALPTPETAYGSSKFAAELIHQAWRDRAADTRRLLVVRPGVVFGPGEGGNVSRLVRSLNKGFFVYAGNRKTRKAGIYVKELCNAMWWMHGVLHSRPPSVITANMTMNPGASMEEYVESVRQVSGRKSFVPSIPVWMLMAAAHVIGFVVTLVGVKSSINPVRVRKLIRSNNIVPGVLVKEGYTYKFTLESALRDWLASMPKEWLR